MYSSLGIIKNSKHSGRLMGTHQKIDKAARRMLSKYLDTARTFPSTQKILHFEGSNGPDGLKRKSPGVDEPLHFINPDDDDGILIGYIRDHHYNLVQALVNNNRERAAFEAAWMAHAITDGLTPAHHYPYKERVDELTQDKDYKKLFGVKIKGIMRGDNLAEAARNNWLYWGAGGIMTKHIAFEYGVAYSIAFARQKRLMLKMSRKNFKNIDYEKTFYRALERVAKLKMYDRFLENGWTTELAMDTYQVLIPEIIRTVALNWASCINEAEEMKKNAQK
jgi:hypothetical protein